MASIRFTMEVIPAKQQELLQALYELRSAMHTEKGFLDARDRERNNLPMLAS